MSVVDHGAFLRWVVPSFGQGGSWVRAGIPPVSAKTEAGPPSRSCWTYGATSGGSDPSACGVAGLSRQRVVARRLEGSWSMAGDVERFPSCPWCAPNGPWVFLLRSCWMGAASVLPSCSADALLLAFRGGHGVWMCAFGDCEGAVLVLQPQSTPCPGPDWVSIPTVADGVGGIPPRRLICLAMRTATGRPQLE